MTAIQLSEFRVDDARRVWDALASVRFEQIQSGRDITFRHVLVPALLRQLRFGTGYKVLDAGCGTGVLSPTLARNNVSIVGVDPSTKSIEIARRHFSHLADFHAMSLESFANRTEQNFDVIISNMVLMDVPNLLLFLRAARRLAHRDTTFVWTMTHPFFWPKYAGYDSADWFNYRREIFIEDDFRISLGASDPIRSIHVHRPLDKLMSLFIRSGWNSPLLTEPFPEPSIEKKYPKPWLTPRYLLGVSRPNVRRSIAYSAQNLEV